MPKVPLVVACLWAAFIVGWLVLAQFNKKASSSVPWRRRALGLRLLVMAVVLVVVSFGRHAGRHAGVGLATSIRGVLLYPPGVVGQWLGVGLMAVGIGFAFWARAHLGRNWGIPMSLREGHELVTSGPYAHVRHPIYTGLMLATIGTALAMGLLGLVFFALAFAYFLVSARAEEKMMLAQFPDTYPAYRRRTKMLIPFVF
ncbi:MAG: methyltransferase family protein [Steroidobacteraceae bacterium]